MECFNYKVTHVVSHQSQEYLTKSFVAVLELPPVNSKMSKVREDSSPCMATVTI